MNDHGDDDGRLKCENHLIHPDKIHVFMEKVTHYDPNSFFYELNDEVIDWLNSNEIRFLWTNAKWQYNDFYFDNEKDAILFKMMWG